MSTSCPGNGYLHAFQYLPLTALQVTFGIEKSEQADELSYEPCPPGLVAGAQPRAVVAVEVLIEKDMVPPLRVLLEFLVAAIHGPPPGRIAEEYTLQPLCQF